MHVPGSLCPLPNYPSTFPPLLPLFRVAFAWSLTHLSRRSFFSFLAAPHRSADGALRDRADAAEVSHL